MLLQGEPPDNGNAKSVPARRKRKLSANVKRDVSVVNASARSVNVRRRKKKRKGNKDELLHVVYQHRRQVHVVRRRPPQLLTCSGVAEMRIMMANPRK